MKKGQTTVCPFIQQQWPFLENSRCWHLGRRLQDGFFALLFMKSTANR
jgi:hypothetical protein